jgi:phospholipid-binding lipoprotein MlaA
MLRNLKAVGRLGHGKQNALAVFVCALFAVMVLAGPAAANANKAKPQVRSEPKVVVNFAAARGPNDDFTGNTELEDPFEGINRGIFFINDGIDLIIIRPAAFLYRTILPSFVRTAIGNFLANMLTPITLTNDILQGEWERAETTFVRFLINTTGGVGGLDDLAARAGYPKHYEDTAQTLAVHGIPSGPYLMLPIIGPATPRHVVGRVADIFLNPWTYILYDEKLAIRLTPTAVEFLNVRADNLEALDAVRSTSPDYYASIKSIYWQNRQNQIANGKVVVEDLPEIPD